MIGSARIDRTGGRIRLTPLQWDSQTHAPRGAATVTLLKSHRSGLNRRPLDYESSALPLSYCGRTDWRMRDEGSASVPRACPDSDSNRDALRHHPLKMACLPVSPSGQIDPFPLSLIPVLHGSDGVRTRDLSSDSRVL